MVSLSRKGRKKLLRELLSNNQKLTYKIPSWMEMKSKKADFTFKRRVKKFNADVDLHKVVGTTHPDYEGLSWTNIYYYLKRPGNILDAINKQEYYEKKLQDPNIDKEHLSFIKLDDEYYIDEGNHRTVLAKIKGINEIKNVTVVQYKTDYDYKKYYNKLREYNFEIDFVEELSRIRNNEYKWETFIIKVDNRILELYSLDIIKEFYYKFINLYTGKFYIFLNKFKRVFNMVFDIKNNYNNEIPNFFIENYGTLVKIKNEKNTREVF